MKTKLLLLTSGAAIFITACTSIDADGIERSGIYGVSQGYGVAGLKVAPYEGKPETLTAESGDILFQQSATYSQTYALEESFSFNTAAIAGIKFELSHSDTLYRVRTQQYGNLFCSYELVGKPFTGSDQRACFRDRDADGKFEQLWSTDENYATEGVFSVYAQYLNYEIDPPISYSETSPNVTLNQTFAVDYSYGKGIFGPAGVDIRQVVVTEDGYQLATNLGQEELKINDEFEFPVTVKIAGAEIELTDITDDVLTYKVISGFPTSRPIGTMVPQKPKSTTVYVPGY